MSLLAWYPMAGDSSNTWKNQGLSDGSFMCDTSNMLVTGNGFGDEHRYVLGRLDVLDDMYKQYGELVYEFSFCSWIKIIEAGDRNDGYFLSNFYDTHKFGLCFEATGSDVSLLLFIDSSYISIAQGLKPNKYMHLAVTYSAGVVTTYINGEIVNTTANVSIEQQSGEVILSDGSKVEIFDVRYYNECISKLQVHDISLGLFIHIPLDNIDLGNIPYDTTLVVGRLGSIAVEQRIRDCSGFGHDVICRNSSIEVRNDALAIGVNCPRFSGNLRHCLKSLSINEETFFCPRYNFTVAFFATPDDHDGNILISGQDGSSPPWYIVIDNGYIKVRLRKDASTYKDLEFEHISLLGDIYTMHHFAFTFDGLCLKTYVDGKFKHDYTFDLFFELAYLSGDGFTIGHMTTSCIQDYRVYGTVLSEEEIGRICSVMHELDNKYNAYSKCFYELDIDHLRQGHNDKGVCFTDDFYNHTDNYDLEVKRFSIPGRAGTFLKIFSHNCRDGGVLFSSVIEAMNCNTQYKFSALSRLGDFCFDGKFEFILRYPQDSALGMNWWTLTSNPTTTTETVSGYTPISISWTAANWGGLAKSSLSNTYLKGSIGNTNWYYAIGAMRNYMGGIPSWAATMGTVELWVRVPDKYAIWRSFITANNFIEI